MSSYYAGHYTARVFPVIDLGDYVLREKRDSDVEDFFSYYSHPEVNKYILCEIPQELESARRELYYWRDVFYRGDGIYFAIATKAEDRMIGSIGITGYNAYHGRIELSYDLSHYYWRKGITYAAIQAIVEYGFREWKINRIEAFTSVENIASRNLLQKSGFTFEGTLRQHRYHRGRYVDACSFSILRSDISTAAE
jgi:ribosomal-protein-alanine N-acetyltransferase